MSERDTELDQDLDQENQEAGESGINYLGMSDEALMQLPPPELGAAAAPAEDAEEEAAASAEEDDDAAGEAATDGDADDAPAAGGEAEAAAAAPASDEAGKEGEEVKPAGEGEQAALDYKAEYEKLLKPFKANGRDFAVKSVEDAITLMQMGANYNKKMAALKPNLKLMRMLENNGLLSEEKLSFLIDLEKKNPQAIQKLVKDAGVDPMTIDPEKAGEYQPSTYTVDDRELVLDEVLDGIKETPTYSRTLEVIGTKWDAASKRVIADNPQVISLINSHMESGIYDVIAAELESERVLGRLAGLSDIEAYRKVGDAIQARGGFNHLFQGSAPAQRQPQATPPASVPAKPQQAHDGKLNDKRRAASAPRPAAPAAATPPRDFNPLAMSDEEFSKTVQTQYL